MSSLPSTCADITNVPRVPGSMKLQRLVVDDEETQEFHYQPWRSQENHTEELMEIIHRFTPPGSTICDPFCGTMSMGLAAFRMNRVCILSDEDADLVAAAPFRLKYYMQWAMKTYEGLGVSCDPPPHDGLPFYRFHNRFVQARYVSYVLPMIVSQT